MLSFALKKIKDLGFIHGLIHNASENKIRAFFCYLKAGKENGFNVKYKILTQDNEYNTIPSNLFNTNNTNRINKTLKKSSFYFYYYIHLMIILILLICKVS